MRGKPLCSSSLAGTLNRIGGHLAAATGRKPLPDGQGPGDSYLARARIDASVWSRFLIGAGLSGMAGSHFRMWALLPPCVVMIALGLFSECPTLSPEKRITSSILRSPVYAASIKDSSARIESWQR
jgi:uncharacterized membrane protein YoaK (UPF0700 family)